MQHTHTRTHTHKKKTINRINTARLFLLYIWTVPHGRRVRSQKRWWTWNIGISSWRLLEFVLIDFSAQFAAVSGRVFQQQLIESQLNGVCAPMVSGKSGASHPPPPPPSLFIVRCGRFRFTPPIQFDRSRGVHRRWISGRCHSVPVGLQIYPPNGLVSRNRPTDCFITCGRSSLPFVSALHVFFFFAC